VRCTSWERSSAPRSLLAGPAATRESAPLLTADSRPYPLVSFTTGADSIEVTDPAWPGRIEAGPATQHLVRKCDGATFLRDLVAAVARETRAEPDRLSAEAQRLANEGVLAPGR
jgi:hypothetical protein